MIIGRAGSMVKQWKRIEERLPRAEAARSGGKLAAAYLDGAEVHI
jgi:hypothetical protein